MKILNKIRLIDESINTPTIVNIKPYQLVVEKINEQHLRYQPMSEEDLRNAAKQMVGDFKGEETSDQFIIRSYALIKEVCYRKLGQMAFDEQLVVGLILLECRLAEMQTGEGKTLAAVFPTIFHALSKKGVHVLTFNDYLASRDAGWMRPVAEFFNLSTAFIKDGQSFDEHRKAFQADILYASAKQMAYAYLRNKGAQTDGELVMRPFYYAIVDEADAVLIDEAKNPFVLAGKMNIDMPDFSMIDSFVKTLVKEKDFLTGKYSRNIYLSDEGRQKVEEKFSISELESEQNRQMMSAIHLSLHAQHLLRRDVDYIVKNNTIQLVDPLTGRVIEDRKWRNGLQTAVEAKEGVPLKSEGAILLSTSMQHFMLRYPKLAAMTATARESSNEFMDYYGLTVVIVPPIQPSIRQDLPDRVFTTKKKKYSALVECVKEIHSTGQPILIGTCHIKESELIYHHLKKDGINCEILNAKNDELESEIIMGAGKQGSIVISTNMAGRGTDIKLGGGESDAHRFVQDLGGLFVLATNRHESKRIDRQLIGRSGRQGDIGSSRFFISLEDDLMQQYQLSAVLPKSFKEISNDDEIFEPAVLDSINHIQEVVEGQGYQMRKTIFEYSSITEYQDMLLEMDRADVFTDVLSSSYLTDQVDFRKAKLVKEKIRNVGLAIIDTSWAAFLNDVQEKKEASGFVKLGGIHPLREHRKYCHRQFDLLKNQIQEEISHAAMKFIEQPDLTIQELGYSRPSSTWTYTVNDKLFGDQLAMMLIDSGNLGMQVDPISGFLLFLRGIWLKMKR